MVASVEIETVDLWSMICNLSCPARCMDVWGTRDPSRASLFFFFLIPFSLSSPTKIYDCGKDKRKTNANCKPRESSWLYFSSPNKLPDQIHLAQSTNQRGNFNPLPNSIALGIADICLILPCSKFSYELFYEIKKIQTNCSRWGIYVFKQLQQSYLVSKADGVSPSANWRKTNV